ncbi:hypothetical protein [Enterococcus sp.]
MEWACAIGGVSKKEQKSLRIIVEEKTILIAQAQLPELVLRLDLWEMH